MRAVTHVAVALVFAFHIVTLDSLEGRDSESKRIESLLTVLLSVSPALAARVPKSTRKPQHVRLEDVGDKLEFRRELEKLRDGVFNMSEFADAIYKFTDAKVEPPSAGSDRQLPQTEEDQSPSAGSDRQLPQIEGDRAPEPFRSAVEDRVEPAPQPVQRPPRQRHTRRSATENAGSYRQLPQIKEARSPEPFTGAVEETLERPQRQRHTRRSGSESGGSYRQLPAASPNIGRPPRVRHTRRSGREGGGTPGTAYVDAAVEDNSPAQPALELTKSRQERAGTPGIASVDAVAPENSPTQPAPELAKSSRQERLGVSGIAPTDAGDNAAKGFRSELEKLRDGVINMTEFADAIYKFTDAKATFASARSSRQLASVNEVEKVPKPLKESIEPVPKPSEKPRQEGPEELRIASTDPKSVVVEQDNPSGLVVDKHGDSDEDAAASEFQMELAKLREGTVNMTEFADRIYKFTDAKADFASVGSDRQVLNANEGLEPKPSEKSKQKDSGDRSTATLDSRPAVIENDSSPELVADELGDRGESVVHLDFQSELEKLRDGVVNMSEFADAMYKYTDATADSPSAGSDRQLATVDGAEEARKPFKDKLEDAPELTQTPPQRPPRQRHTRRLGAEYAGSYRQLANVNENGPDYAPELVPKPFQKPPRQRHPRRSGSESEGSYRQMPSVNEEDKAPETFKDIVEDKLGPSSKSVQKSSRKATLVSRPAVIEKDSPPELGVDELEDRGEGVVPLEFQKELEKLRDGVVNMSEFADAIYKFTESNADTASAGSNGQLADVSEANQVPKPSEDEVDVAPKLKRKVRYGIVWAPCIATVDAAAGSLENGNPPHLVADLLRRMKAEPQPTESVQELIGNLVEIVDGNIRDEQEIQDIVYRVLETAWIVNNTEFDLP